MYHFFFPSLGFPDLETGSCRWGSSNCGGFFSSVGFCQLWDFFSSSRLSGFGNRVVQGGSPPSAFRIWKQGSCRGGVDPLSSSYMLAAPAICIIFFSLSRLSGFGNGFVQVGFAPVLKSTQGKAGTINPSPRQLHTWGFSAKRRCVWRGAIPTT